MATEQDLLAARLEDSIKLSRKRPCFLGFLDEAQAAFCQERLSRRQDVAYLSWGGHEYAERVVLGFFPDYLEPAPEYFPITPLVLSYRKEDKLTHRDFLGALMGCGIKRETVGDLYVQAGRCDFLVTREILPYVLDNLTSAGRTRLSLREIPLEEISGPRYSVKELRDTVASLRLDALVGAGFGLARGKAADLIAAGKVSLDGLPCVKPDKPVAEGGKISARGYGKVVLKEISGRTKKDRISIVLEKYV